MPTTTPPRARQLVRYVAFTIHDGRPLGIVLTVGHAPSPAKLLASKRWKFSQQQLVLVEWDDCTGLQRALAASAEATAAAALHAEALRCPA